MAQIPLDTDAITLMNKCKVKILGADTSKSSLSNLDVFKEVAKNFLGDKRE